MYVVVAQGRTTSQLQNIQDSPSLSDGAELCANQMLEQLLVVEQQPEVHPLFSVGIDAADEVESTTNVQLPFQMI